MKLDALAHEPQFIDHLAPIWTALPASVRGSFLVGPGLLERAALRGIPDAIPSQRPPAEPAYPKPRFDGPPCLVASYGDVKVGRRLGYGPFAFVEHGIAQTYNGDPRHQPRSGSYSGGGDRDDNELFIVPNQHAADAWTAKYPQARVEVVGSAHAESLPARRPGPGPVVAISFHWNASSVIQEADTALGEYIPHLADLASRWTLIGHAHPKGDWPEVVERYYRRAGITMVRDFHEVCERADVYVCDNSSTLYEFAATGRPVVVLNSKHYRRDIDHGLRFWEAADVGVQCDRPEDLDDALRLAMVNGPEQQANREHALDIVYAHRRGAARRAAAAIVRWLEERQERAA